MDRYISSLDAQAGAHAAHLADEADTGYWADYDAAMDDIAATPSVAFGVMADMLDGVPDGKSVRVADLLEPGEREALRQDLNADECLAVFLLGNPAQVFDAACQLRALIRRTVENDWVWQQEADRIAREGE